MILVRNRMLKARNKQCPISPEMDGRNLQHLRFVRGLWHIYLWWKWRVSHGFTIWNWGIYSTPVAIKFMGQKFDPFFFLVINSMDWLMFFLGENVTGKSYVFRWWNPSVSWFDPPPFRFRWIKPTVHGKYISGVSEWNSVYQRINTEIGETRKLSKSGFYPHNLRYN